ncbi:hypothetical protein INR49_012202 [Caranx melampygus]|nr:hypothetical protein INR49_012202 [Caranx melampygus]
MISGLVVCTVAPLATITAIVYHDKVRLVRSVYRLRARCQHLPAVRGVAPACACGIRSTAAMAPIQNIRLKFDSSGVVWIDVQRMLQC